MSEDDTVAMSSPEPFEIKMDTYAHSSLKQNREYFSDILE